MALCLAVTSGKGGTGKSTVSAGLAMAFCDLNKTVLLLDMDVGLRCQDILFNVSKNIVFDLADVLEGDYEKGIYSVGYSKKLSLVPAPVSPKKPDQDKFKSFIDAMKEKYDVVIVDFPAGIDFSLYSALGKDTQFLSVASPDPIAIRDSFAVRNNLPETQTSPRLIINKFDRSLIKKGTYGNIDNAIDNSGLRLIGIVPLDTELLLLPINHGMKKNKRPKKAFIRIAKRLLGENIPLPKVKKI